MAAPPYQKLFWGSYHKHTAHLRHAREHGAYLLLIGALWNNDGKLAADDDVLAGYAMLTTKEWLAIKPKLMPLFRIVRGKLTQPRVTEDLTKYKSTSGKRKVAGKAGGIASAEKQRENGSAIGSRLPTKPEPEPDKSSVDKSTGGEAAELPFDPDAQTWNLGVRLLREQGRATEGAARGFIGKLLKERPGLVARDLLPAITGALSNKTQDPQAYLTQAANGIVQRRTQGAEPRRVGFV